MKLVLYPHGGSGNHGCEAIVRSTYKITQADVTLFSASPEEDKKVMYNSITVLYLVLAYNISKLFFKLKFTVTKQLMTVLTSPQY